MDLYGVHPDVLKWFIVPTSMMMYTWSWHLEYFVSFQAAMYESN